MLQRVYTALYLSFPAGFSVLFTFPIKSLLRVEVKNESNERRWSVPIAGLHK